MNAISRLLPCKTHKKLRDRDQQQLSHETGAIMSHNATKAPDNKPPYGMLLVGWHVDDGTVVSSSKEFAVFPDAEKTEQPNDDDETYQVLG